MRENRLILRSLKRHAQRNELARLELRRAVMPDVEVFTDRDVVVEVNAVDLNPNVITVGDIMAPDLVTVREDAGLLEAMEIMRFKGVRRLPVVAREGALVGILSIDDLLEVLAEEMTGMTRIVGRERAHEQASRK